MEPNRQFNGTRLREAREVRQLTITELAAKSGIIKQSISYYEKGQQNPGIDNMISLANALSVPISFFYKETNTSPKQPIFFRSRKGLAQKEWARAEIKLSWFEDILTYLNDVINFVPQNIPEKFNVGSRLASVTRDEIEHIAVECRKYWGLGLGPISHVTKLMENNGVVVIKMPLNVKAEDAFSQWQLEKSIPVAVMVAEKPSACRDRFSLAHELGHLILHRSVSVDEENIDIIEEQANQFASSFLLPAQSYLREFRYPSLDSLKILKHRWKVSIKAQVYRCKELGAISSTTARNLYMNMGKRGWATTEPLDDVIPIEEPLVLTKVLDLLSDQANISLFDIASMLDMSEEDVAALCGVSLPKAVQEDATPTLKKKSAKVIPFKSRS